MRGFFLGLALSSAIGCSTPAFISGAKNTPDTPPATTDQKDQNPSSTNTEREQPAGPNPPSEGLLALPLQRIYTQSKSGRGHTQDAGQNLVFAIPSNAIPSNALPAQALPASALPAQQFPREALPASAIPSNALPAQLWERDDQTTALFFSAPTPVTSETVMVIAVVRVDIKNVGIYEFQCPLPLDTTTIQKGDFEITCTIEGALDEYSAELSIYKGTLDELMATRSNGVPLGFLDTKAILSSPGNTAPELKTPKPGAPITIEAGAIHRISLEGFDAENQIVLTDISLPAFVAQDGPTLVFTPRAEDVGETTIEIRLSDCGVPRATKLARIPVNVVPAKNAANPDNSGPTTPPKPGPHPVEKNPDDSSIVTSDTDNTANTALPGGVLRFVKQSDLSDPAVSALTVNEANNDLWVGGPNSRLTRIGTNAEPIRFGSDVGSRSGRINDMIFHEEKLWLATELGAYSGDPMSGVWKPQHTQAIANPQIESVVVVRGATEDGGDTSRVWFGTVNDGIFRAVDFGFEVFNNKAGNQKLSANTVRAMRRGQDPGRVWLGTNIQAPVGTQKASGVILWDAKDEAEIRNIGMDKGLPESAEVNGIAPIGGGNIIVGTTQGIYEGHQDGNFSRIDLVDSNGLTVIPKILALHRDSSMGLWAGSEKHGLFYLPPNGQWRQVKVLNPYLVPENDKTTWAFADSSQGLWIGSSKGLILWDLAVAPQ